MTDYFIALNNAEFYYNFERVVGFVFAVIVGSGVRLGFKAQRIKLKGSYVIFVLACSTLVGYWVDLWATHNGWISYRGAMVSCAALIAESLISYFFNNDGTIWADIWDAIIKRRGK